MIEKIRIQKQVQDFDDDIFIGGFKDVLTNLKRKFNDLEKKGWTDLELKREYRDFYLIGVNLETDSEFAIRKKHIEAKKKADELQLEKEKQEYERLKAKFES